MLNCTFQPEQVLASQPPSVSAPLRSSLALPLAGFPVLQRLPLGPRGVKEPGRGREPGGREPEDPVKQWHIFTGASFCACIKDRAFRRASTPPVLIS